MTEQWYLVGPDGSDDGDLRSLSVRHGLSPFSNKAEVVLDDPAGTKRAAYPRPTPVELDVEIPGVLSRRRRFAGFVQDHSVDRDSTELLVLSHDFWIRQETDVFLSVTDAPISSVLQELVAETPLKWDASLVDVENDVTITRDWTGEAMEKILGELRSISGGGEFYGATFDREFYWSALESESAPRDFAQGQYLDVGVERDGKRAANRAVVTYGTGDQQATVAANDAAAQRALADRIGSSEPVQIPVRTNRPSITSEARAKSVAELLLEERSPATTATIETWEGFGLEPGQLAQLVHPESNTDEEVRIAQLEYQYPGGAPPTTVTAGSAQLDVSDELVDLTDEVQRVDLRDVSADAPFLETIEERAGISIGASARILSREHGTDRLNPGFGRDAAGFGRGSAGLQVVEWTRRESTSAKATTALLNRLRDVWLGDRTSIEIAEVGVGGDGSSASRTDTSLGNPRGQVPIGHAGTAGASQLAFHGTVDVDADVQEAGLFDGDGTMFASAAFDSALAGPVDVAVELPLAVAPDSRAVATTRGQRLVRDAMAGVDVGGNHPTELAFGTGTTDASESDTSLANRVATKSFNRSKTRGTGAMSARAKLLESDASGAQISEFGLRNGAGDLLTRVVVADVELTGLDLEATQLVAHANA